MASVVLLLTIFSDWMMYGENLQLLWQAGELTTFGMQAGLGSVAALFAFIAYKLANRKASTQIEISSELAPA
jgi:hypothetical protein